MVTTRGGRPDTVREQRARGEDRDSRQPSDPWHGANAWRNWVKEFRHASRACGIRSAGVGHLPNGWANQVRDFRDGGNGGSHQPEDCCRGPRRLRDLLIGFGRASSAQVDPLIGFGRASRTRVDLLIGFGRA